MLAIARTYESYNKVRELIAEKCYIPHCWIPLWSPSKYSPWEAVHRCYAPPFKTILELVLWNGLQCRCITPDVINVIKMPSFKISFTFRNRKKSLEARSGEQAGRSSTVICLVPKNSLTDSAVRAGALSWCKINELLAKMSGRFRLTFSRSLSRTSK